MTEAKVHFIDHLAEADVCLQNYDVTNHEFPLRHVWIVCVSAFDFYMTELVSEAGLRLIDRTPPILTPNLRQIEIPLGNVLEMDQLSPSGRLLFFRQHIFSAVQYVSFYRPEKVSEALSYIWTSPAKEKWTRIITQMRRTGRYQQRAEQYIRDELTLIGDRRDLIAHSVDLPPGATNRNPVSRADASRVVEFIGDFVRAIDDETESQLAMVP
jgi:hypothetical protein